MTKTQFQAACQALWGPTWQSQAAHGLQLGRSTVVRYALGDRAVPPEVISRLGGLLVERQATIARLLTIWRQPK